MNDDWLDQLKQLHEADREKQQAQKPDQTENLVQKKREAAIKLLRQSRAHDLLRQVQKTLLNGGGTLEVHDQTSDYERAITLVWQGPISAARRPDENDSEPYYYILVGVRQDKLWVNGKSLKDTSSEALKVALLQASKKPGREKR